MIVKTTIIFAILIIMSVYVNAQTPVYWSATANTPVTALKAGTKTKVQVTARIDQGWYIYSITQPAGGPIRTQISVAEGQPFKRAGTITGPRPKIKFDKNFGINVESYAGTAVFNIPVRVAGGAGRKRLVLNVQFQACNGETCLLPKTARLEL